MSKVIDLLKEKNFYLEKFLLESKNERASFKARRFENLESLYNKREQILTNIQSIDQRINNLCSEGKLENSKGEVKEEVSDILEQIKKNVRFILEEDLSIISCIENEKTKIIHEISKSRHGRRALKAYKSKNSAEV